jgi:ionotropic glutamate receptor
MQKFDAVVGDTTIVANRSSYVDFTLPYSESGVSMVVSMKDNEKKNMWIFLKPLSWDLWLAIGIVSIFIGLVTWVLEHHVNTKFRGPPNQQIGTIFLFSFATLTSSYSKFSSPL